MKIPQLTERKFLFAVDQPINAPLYEIVIAQNGVFKRARRREMTAAVEVSAFATPIPELAVGAAQIELTEKIPGSVFDEILFHAQCVTDRQNFTENLYAVYWDEKRERYFWKEVSRYRSFGSTIANDDDPAYQTAVLEIHTHPPNCLDFSAQDDRDESGKFRLFGILVDIHSPKPAICLRIGIYDSFWQIPVDMVAGEPPASLTDLVKQEREQQAETCDSLGEKGHEFIYVDELHVAQNLLYVENL